MKDSLPRLFAGAAFVVISIFWGAASDVRGEPLTMACDLRVGAAAVNLKCDKSMVLAGMIEARYTDEQEGELRAAAIVVETAEATPGTNKIAIVACDVLWVPASLVDPVLVEIQKATGIAPQNVLINATHTHHAPSTAPAHGFGVSLRFCAELKRAIVAAVRQANERLAGGDAALYFALGEERTVGANSRLKLPDGNITWLNPAAEAGKSPIPTGPFDPQLPVLDFRDPRGKTRALIYNHSTHTIGTRSGRNVRSPGFYGLAAQELESEIGGTVLFLEGASGSTHNITNVPVAEAIVRMKKAVEAARAKAVRHPVARIAALGRTLKFRVRHFDDAVEDAKIARYTTRYVKSAASSDLIRRVFADMRRKLKSEQGKERETYVQAILIGDVALVGVPAEYFTVLGMDIKKRSPFKYTYVAELANDWIGYLPDREAMRLGGYQTWMGLHSYAEAGTGERVADLAVELLNELAQTPNAARAEPPDKPEALQAGQGRRSPDAERRTFRLADPKLTVELVASEPDVVSPVAFAWDADGRLYVAEMGGYPNTRRRGRIRQLRDDDGDGRYERSTVFAEGLNFPATVMPYRDGILTIDAPDLLFLRDTNADGRADERSVLWTGFVAGSQQLRANALHWGLDNWIYGANGRCDGEIRRPGDKSGASVSIRGRDFRFRPWTGQFEAIAGQSQFGQCHDDFGRRFLSWNTVPIRQAVVPEPFATRRSALAARAVVDIAPADDSGRVFPISPPPRQFNAERADFYNAMCGLTIFRGDALGDAYRGNAFVGESLSNLVTRRVLKPCGAASVSERGEIGREFLASEDAWFHPVFLATGPDGALYLADFYREYVEHPIYVASEEIRKRIAWNTGAENGRLWRIRRAGGAAPADRRRPRLSAANTADLVAVLAHPVGWWRDTAQRLLIERQDKSAVPLLQAAFRDAQSTLGALHALWTLEGLSAADESIVRRAIEADDPRIREQGVALVCGRPAQVARVLPQLAERIDDADPAVRMRLALALGTLPADEVRLNALVQLARVRPRDPWILSAVLASATDQAGGLVRLLSEVDGSLFSDVEPEMLAFLHEAGRQIAGELQGDELAAVADWCADDGSVGRLAPGRLTLLSGIVEGAEGAGHGGRRAAERLFPVERRKRIARDALQAARDAAQPIYVRRACVRLVELSRGPETAADFVTLLVEPACAPIRAACANSLSALDDLEASRAVYREWDRLGGEARRAVIAAGGSSDAAAAALLEAVAKDVVRTVEVPIDLVERLKNSAAQANRQRAAELFRQAVSPDRLKVVERYRPSLSLRGDAVRGAAVFRDHCLACHAIQRFGQQVGPELSGMSSRPREILLHDILDPSARISSDFLSYVVVTREGKTIEGLLVAQSSESVRLRRARGEETVIDNDAIEQMRANVKSLMPEGFETKIDARAMADLLAFLRQPSRDLLKASVSSPSSVAQP